MPSGQVSGNSLLGRCRNRYVKPGIEEKVEEERLRLMSGTFDVFYGPITDNQGVVRVKEGQSMTDENMLNDFFWYVEGVVIDESE